MFTLRIGSSLSALALLVLACAPKYTPEIASQRFVTEADASDVLATAAVVFRAKELSIVAATDTYVCGEQPYFDTRHTGPGDVTEYTLEPARGWRLLRVSAVGEDGTTRVTLTPSPSFIEGSMVRFPGEVMWLGDEEARRSWCEDPRGEDTPIAEKQVLLAEDVALRIRKGLTKQES